MLRRQNKKMVNYEFWVPVMIAIVALIISFYASGVFSSFDLKIYVDGYLLPKSTITGDSADTFPIAIPLIFTNEGKKEGIVEDVILVIKNTETSDKTVYSPVVEIDFNKYITGKRALHAENIIAPNFYPFTLTAKEMKSKTFLFTQDRSVKNNSLTKTKSGKYIIEIYTKTSKKDYYKINNFTLNFDVDKYNSRGSEYIGRINFPYSTFNLNNLDK